MSRAELAELVNAWVDTHTGQRGALDEHYVGRLEQGRVSWPGEHYRAALRAVLGVAGDADLGFRPPQRRLVSPLTVALDPVEDLSPDEAERLSAVQVCPRRTDAAALDAVAGVLSAVRRLEDQTNAATVLPTVTAQQELTVQLARGARRSVRADAVGLLSEITQYRGWLSIPLGRWADAQRFLDRAAVLATEADDPNRRSTALSFAAYRALRRGDLRSADALSEAACRDERVHIGLRTYEIYQRAEVLARDGDRTQATQLLHRADAMLDHLPPPEELPSFGYWYVPAFFLGQTGFVLKALGETQAAREAGRASLAAMPAEWASSEWAERRRRLAEE
jgi:tetratricopeptide (TPR) repeat protein